MPLDSGPLSTLRPADSFIHSLQNAIAYQQNIPITLLSRNLPHEFQNAKNPVPQDLSTLPPTVFERCLPLLHKWKEWKSFFQASASNAYAYPPSYANPAIRLLRDYWAWSWSELLEIGNAVSKLNSTDASHLFFPANAGFAPQLSSLIFSLDPQYILLLGPFLLQRNDLEPLDFETIVRRDVDRFNEAVYYAWTSIPNPLTTVTSLGKIEPNKPLYSSDHILRLLFSRAKAETDDVLDSAKRVRFYYAAAKAFFEATKQSFRPDAIGRLVSTLDASVGKEHIENHDAFNLRIVIALPRIKNNEVRPAQYEITFTGANVVDIQCRESDQATAVGNVRYHKRLDSLYTTWNAYHYETFIVLRNYLNRKFGIYAVGEDANAISNKVGDRIVRLIVRSLEADEGAIYRVDYSDKSKPLVRYGAYTEFAWPENRREIMGEHMSRIAPNRRLRKRSISYRAIDVQRTQVCKFFNREKDISIPAGQTLSFPPDSPVDWGNSACASPIIVGGETWGVLEVISARPWSFYEENVKKIEELCTLVSPFFYYQSIFALLSDANRIVADPQIAFKTKIEKLCTILPKLFMADSAAVYFRQKDNEFFPFASVFRRDVESFLRNSDGGESKRVGGLECSLLENIATEIREYTIGESPFDEKFFLLNETSYFQDHIGDRLLAIPLSEIQEVTGKEATFGLITLVIGSHPKERSDEPRIIAPSAESTGSYEFLRRHLTVAFQLVYASYVWERLTRSYLSHEVSRLEIEFAARLKRARSAMQRIENEAIKYQILQSLRDLEQNLGDLKHFNTVFRSVSFVDRSDPLITAAAKARDDEQKKATEPISLREIVNQVFKSRQSQADERSIKINNRVEGLYPKVRIGRRNLTEMLGNLAENAVKYARDRSVIDIRLERDGGDVLLTISNLGPWISETDRRRVFEEGFRAPYAIAAKVPGIGRGLGYAREIMRLYDGDIRYVVRPTVSAKPGVEEAQTVWHNVQLKFPADLVVTGG